LLKLPKNGLHLALTQCADIDSRADRHSKPCLLLSCYQAVDVLCLAGPALSFANCDQAKTRRNRPGSKRRAGSLQSLWRPLGRLSARHVRQIDRGQDAGTAAAVPVARRSDAGPLWQFPVLWRADERADMAISTRMPRSRLHKALSEVQPEVNQSECKLRKSQRFGVRWAKSEMDLVIFLVAIILWWTVEALVLGSPSFPGAPSNYRFGFALAVVEFPYWIPTIAFAATSEFAVSFVPGRWRGLIYLGITLAGLSTLWFIAQSMFQQNAEGVHMLVYPAVCVGVLYAARSFSRVPS
jgi:hypothetical protein